MQKKKWKRKCKRKIQKKESPEIKGQMTIYLILMLMVLIPLVFTVIEAARVSAMRLQLECVMDAGCDSLLSEYHRGLLEKYHLLLIDTSYENDIGSLDYVKDHLIGYMDYNLHPEKDLALIGSRDLFGLETESVDFLKVSRATDNNGEVFRYMAVSYMLEKYGIAYVADAKDLVQQSESSGIFDSDILTENEQSQQAINEIELPEPEEGEDWEEVTIDNPTEGVNQVRDQGILSLVCQDTVSGKEITPSQYVSGRNLVEGDGLWEEWDSRNALEEQLLFNEYIMQECSNHGNVREGSLLDYEVEYIIAGKSNDTENLKTVANRLLLIRGGANSVYFFSNYGLMAEAEAAAASLSCVIALPELEVIFKAAIIAAWIYAESVCDVRMLMDGKKVPLLKAEGQWNLSLENALGITQEAIAGADSGGEGTGLNYEEYIRLLLYITPLDQRTLRMMDIVEMNIRQTQGQENFRLDDCIAAFEVQSIFNSSYGYSFLMKQETGYR